MVVRVDVDSRNGIHRQLYNRSLTPLQQRYQVVMMTNPGDMPLTPSCKFPSTVWGSGFRDLLGSGFGESDELQLP